ncbi:HAD family hydrolase [Spirillospora sp. CA-142024]|uniref:HAD family hydrolase n=1 Tax=Spirillospora sp. CA-142024 TaxID=3240036 RepID=UPI003D8A3285
MTSLSALIQTSRAILLDFDGPVCRLFSAVPAPGIADKIRSFLLERSAYVPEPMMAVGDPLVLLRWTGDTAPHLLSEVERIQTDSEIEAARLAEPTSGAAELIRSSGALGRPVVIVTNNSTEAVAVYLDRLALAASITGISSRIQGRPDLMKPDSHLVLKGAAIAGQSANACVLIGDSPTDMLAAKKAGARCVGYAKRKTRISELSDAGADFVVQSMELVADIATQVKG